MTEQVANRRLMRILAAILTALWAATAIAIATAYRPGGPIDIVVALACFLPVLIADAGFVWPPVAVSQRHRAALVWLWIGAVLFAIPVLYGVGSSLTGGGPQSLVPSFEAAYAGIVALFLMALFSVVGLVHRRRGAELLERRALALSASLAVVLTIVVGIAFGFVALVNDQALRDEEPRGSRFGPTNPDLEPLFCDEPLKLGQDAVITIEAKSSLDNVDRGTAVLKGQRGGRGESWGGSWEGVDHEGQQAYLRVGPLAWLNDQSDDPHAPGTTWSEVQPDPFDMLGAQPLTMDGPPHSVVNVPRGSIVAEDLGLEIIEGARARHCRTLMAGPAALDTFLPLRWLLYGDSGPPSDRVVSRWRGEMDWWVFADGELGLASVEVSGSRADTTWDAEGVRAVLEARLEATHRERPVDVAAPVTSSDDSRSAPPTSGAPAPPASRAPAPPPSTAPAGALESAAP